MSAHNFWNNFTHGFMHGMFSNNPFFGGCMSGWGGFFQFNSCFNPFFMPYTSCISPFPNNTSLFLVPNVMSGIGFSPLMPDFAMPAPSFNIDMNKLFPTDKWQTPAYSSPPAFGDVFVKSSNNSVTVPSIETSDYNFTFSSTKTKTSKAAKTKTTPATYQPSSLSSTRTTSLASLKAKHWTEMTDSEMRQVYGDYTRDITTPYKGTAADLNKYLEGKGVLSGQGQAFIDAQNKYGISASALIGIAMNESAQGTSSHAKNKKNVGGVRIPGSTTFKTYSSVAECIDDMARFLKNGYVNNKGRSLTKLYQINAKYCPSSDPTDKEDLNSLWARNVNKYAREVESALV
ncbi:MAG: hypothetical protein BHW62_06435 [Acinetobacter sp. CAG:196_36_41]|nr:MAG: hypothetical protein BHW62_06435 [Acinetobacter sp. CAG:196_36_41]